MRVGIIGAGVMGVIHARLYEKMKGVDIAFVCDSDVTKENVVHKICGAPFFSACTGDILELADIVDICVPNYLHYHFIEKAHTMGKDIIVEKPLCIHLDELLNIKKMVKTKSVNVGCCYTERLNPAYTTANQVLEQELGEVQSIHCVRMAKVPPMSWYLDEARSGGIIPDLSTHDIDITVWMSGRSPNGLIAEYLPPESAVLKSVHLTIDFPEGVKGDIKSYWLSPNHPHNFYSEIRIVGNQGSVMWNNNYEHVVVNTPTGIKKRDLPTYDCDEIKYKELYSLIEFIQGQPNNCIIPEELLETTEVTLCAKKSLQERKYISI